MNFDEFFQKFKNDGKKRRLFKTGKDLRGYFIFYLLGFNYTKIANLVGGVCIHSFVRRVFACKTE